MCPEECVRSLTYTFPHNLVLAADSGFINHFTDREWAYDRDSHIGRLDKGLVEAEARGWTVVDMKKDWKTVYPFGSADLPGQTQ